MAKTKRIAARGTNGNVRADTYERLKQAIIDNEYRPGEIVGISELARDLGVSPATVSEAAQALAAVGAIQARGRAGTFVRDTGEPSRPARYLGIGGDPLAHGSNLSTSTGAPSSASAPSMIPACNEQTTRG